LTFSQAFAVPGRVLPAGTYTFRLTDSLSDSHIVQIFNQTGTQLMATVLTIADYRVTPTDDTVITFGERHARHHALFYPGSTLGQEFIYPKQRLATPGR
jgi:hypothetical protein